MEPLRVNDKRLMTSGFEENYYRVIFALFGLAFLFSYFYSTPGPEPLDEFLVPRHLFAILPFTLAAITYLSQWVRDHIRDIGSGYFLVCSLYLIGFLATNGFHTHYEIGIITLVLISNLHMNKVLYIVLYNVIVLTVLEFVFITAAPAANVQPVLFFIFLLLCMLLCIFYQLYRIRFYARQQENEQLTGGLISGNPDAWMIFEAPGMVAVDAGPASLELFAIDASTPLEQVSLRTLIAAGSANESDDLIKTILSDTVTGIKTQCRKQTGELFWTDISAFRIPGKLNLVHCRFIDISEEKWSQENATGNAIRYRSYLDVTTEGILVCDRHGNIRIINKTALRLLRSNITQSLVNKDISEVTGTQTAGALRAEFEQMIASESLGVSKHILSADFPHEFIITGITDIIDNSHEFLVKILPVEVEAAEPKPHREEPITPLTGSKASEQLLLAIPLAVAFTRQDGAFAETNAGFYELTGYNASETGKLKLEQLVHPSQLHAFRQFYSVSVREMRAVSGTFKLIHKGGQSVITAANLYTFTAEDGSLKTACIFNDITQFRKTEAALQEAGSNVVAVIENTDASIFSVDFNHRITVMNSPFIAEMVKRTGKTPLKGDDFRMFLDVSVRETWNEIIRQVMRGRKVVREESVTYEDGQTDLFEVSYFPIATEEHMIIGVSVLSQKVTERKKIEAELVKAKEIAERATKAKSEFLATMSHEIRTPLNGLLGMTDLLSTTLLNTTQQEYVDAIKLSGDALLTVINDVLDYSRIESGKMELDHRPFELAGCVRETVDMLRFKAREKGNRLSYAIDENIPEIVVGDKARLRQILVNLVGNAIKFTDQGQIDISVQPEKISAGELVLRFAVKDTGIGMTQEQMDRLFKSFTQAETSTFGKYGGSGLGLTISQRLTELMGGTIRVESAPGKGSTFYFTIRVTAGTRDQVPGDSGRSDSKPAAVPAADTGFAKKYPLQILIAEDNEINRLLVKKQFQKLGYDPLIVEDGLQAVEATRRNGYDIIFMDVQMPNMDGFEATRAIKNASGKETKTPVIVALTARVMEGDREKCLAAGMDEYLPKPVPHQELIEILIRTYKNQTNGKKKETPGEAVEPMLIDLQIINRLKMMAEDDATFLGSLVGLYLKQSAEIIEEIAELAAMQNFTATAQAAHKLKGSSLNLGARYVAALCRQVEEAAHDGDKDRLEKVIRDLPGVFQSTGRELKKIAGVT